MHDFLDSLGQPILVASHPRSGTHLTIDLLRRQFSECSSWKYPGEPLDRLYLAVEGLIATQKKISAKTAKSILRRSPRPLLKTHANPRLSHLTQDYADLKSWVLQNATKIYVMRDGRSVLCSLHLFMQSFDPTARCSLSQFLRQEANGQSRVKAWSSHIQAWIDQPHVHLLKFEDLIHQPHQTLTDLGRLLALKPKYVEPYLPRSPKTIWHGRLSRLTQTQPESTAIIGYYGGQKGQKWHKAFTPKDREFFHAEAGTLLQKLGYIDGDDWIEASDI